LEDYEGYRYRGSFVWFNQASMFMTSELGVETVKEARKAGIDPTYNFGGHAAELFGQASF
jgi:hypothetical protein